MKRLKMLAAATLVSFTAFAATAPSLAEIPLQDIDGKDTALKAYKGKVVLLVNVASKCGYTKQYNALEATYQKYKSQGLVIVGVPCNDFGGQEPGTPDEIKTFCSTKFNVSFPLMGKVHVKGAEQHPLYAALTGKEAKLPGDVKWNFAKFLLNRKGEVVSRYDSATTPDDPAVVAAIEAALKAK